MILPGTLVQARPECGPFLLLRPMGIYTVRSSHVAPHQSWCRTCRGASTECAQTGIHLCELLPLPEGTINPLDGRPVMGGWSLCDFRILAPPITEADRLEMSAPDNDGAKQPAKRKETV